MVKVINEAKKEFEIEMNKNGSSGIITGIINGNEFTWDVVDVKEKRYSVIKNNQSYQVEVLAINKKEKSCAVKVNGLIFRLNIKDKYDELLQHLGMDNLSNNKVSDLKAPMPGLVLDISTAQGETVKKGDALFILEAMKMENIIKSPTDGIIKDIAVDKGETVEKNQVILNFE